MRKIIILGILALIAFGAQAQLLWKVSGNGAKGDSYLFGTHHIAPIELLDSIRGLNAAICSADAIVGEIDMAAMQDPMAAQMAMMKYAMAPADSTLTRLLTVAQIDSLNAVLGKYTDGLMTVQMVDGLAPALVSTQLALLQSQQAFPDFTPSEQLDTEVQTRARNCSREIIGLETMEQQFELLYGAPISMQLDVLMEAVRQDETSVTKAHELAAAYLSGNLDTIYSLLVDSDEMDVATLDRLLISRNNAWVEKIAEWLPEKSIFVAVGIGHLVGPQGLIEQLRHRGFQVTEFSEN